MDAMYSMYATSQHVESIAHMASMAIPKPAANQP